MAASMVAVLALCDHGQRAAATQSAAPPRPERLQATTEPEPQVHRIYAPLGPLGAGPDVDVLLNNNSPEPMTVTPTLFRKGRAIVGTAIVLQPAEATWVSLSDLVPDGRSGDRPIDAIELTYLGDMLEIGAQIVSRSHRRRGSVDVMFSGPADFKSSTLGAVWSAPRGGRAVITLGNSTQSPLNVTVREGRRRRVLEIEPHDTRTLVRLADHFDVTPESVMFESDGSPGALRISGYIEANGRVFGTIPFYDPAAARGPDLYASNVRIRNTDVQMTLLNTSDKPIWAKPQVRPTTREAGAVVDLRPVFVPARTAVMVDTRRLSSVPGDRVNVHIGSSGPAGGLIGYLAAVDRASLLAYEVPLRDVGPIRQSTGSYPWRLDGSYEAKVSITNVSAVTAPFSATIAYPGGLYTVKPEMLAPGATATFDIRQIRDEQVPDLSGATLPLTLERGQFKWSIGGPTKIARLNGRMEIASARDGVTSSYSCGQCCPDSYDYGILQPSSVWTPTGWSTGFTVISQLRTCYGGAGGQLYSYANSWNVFNPPVASVATTGWGTADATGLSGGDTYIEGSWSAYIYVAEQENCTEFQVPGGGSGQVQVQTPASLQVVDSFYVTQQFNNYNRERHYAVLDQNGQVIARSGMSVTESYSSWSHNGCNLAQIGTGSASTNSQGRFKDNYSMSGAPNCPTQDTCTSTATQTIQVSGHTVASWPVTYGCTGVTVNNQ